MTASAAVVWRRGGGDAARRVGGGGGLWPVTLFLLVATSARPCAVVATEAACGRPHLELVRLERPSHDSPFKLCKRCQLPPSSLSSSLPMAARSHLLYVAGAAADPTADHHRRAKD